MSFAVTMENGLPVASFTSGSDLLTNVILSLEIKQGSFFADPSFGLKPRPRAKRTAKTARLLKGDVEQALQWLIDCGRATAVDVTVELDNDDRNRMDLAVAVTGAQGNPVSYQKFVEVV
jgi:phage gp46-like protein